MDITPEARQRLARYLEERALYLGLTWREVAKRADISIETLRLLRAGDDGARPVTLRKVDRGLEWTPGSAARVLYEAGEPEDIFTPEERRTMLMYPGSVAEGVARREGGRKNGATG